MEKFISVVIPAYNAQNTIKKAIESANFEDVEIIIVIDGAKDNTFEVCNTLKNKNIKIIQQENKGQFQARMVGIENATGKYIMFLDSDDYYEENAIKKIKELIEKYQMPDLIRFRYKKNPEGYEQYKYFEENQKEILKKDFIEYVYPFFIDTYMLNALWTNCVKRDVLNKINIANSYIKYGEDLLLNLEIFSNIKNAVFVNDILYNYINNPKSVTHNNSSINLTNKTKDAISVYSLLHIYLKRWDMNTFENIQKVNNRIQKEINILINLYNSIN